MTNVFSNLNFSYLINEISFFTWYILNRRVVLWVDSVPSPGKSKILSEFKVRLEYSLHSRCIKINLCSLIVSSVVIMMYLCDPVCHQLDPHAEREHSHVQSAAHGQHIDMVTRFTLRDISRLKLIKINSSDALMDKLGRKLILLCLCLQLFRRFALVNQGQWNKVFGEGRWLLEVW